MLPIVLGALLVVQQPRDPSIYHIRAGVDAPVILGASLSVLLGYLYADRIIKPHCPCDPRDVNAFDRPAIGNTSALARKLSDGTAGAVILLPFVLDAFDIGPGRAFNEDAFVLAETMAINSALVSAAKYIVQRPLPRTYAGDSILLHKSEGYRSFYSGHTSMAFAALSATAMTLRLRHGERIWPWVVTGVVGTSVAIERVADGRHFPSDVIVGAIMGTATGIIVPALHARKAPARQGLLLDPTPRGGMVIGWSIRF